MGESGLVAPVEGERSGSGFGLCAVGEKRQGCPLNWSLGGDQSRSGYFLFFPERAKPAVVRKQTSI